MIPVVDKMLGDCLFLHSIRSRAVSDPHMKLTDLVTLDERLESYIAALESRAEGAWSEAYGTVKGDADPSVFVAAVLDVRGRTGKADPLVGRLFGPSGLVRTSDEALPKGAETSDNPSNGAPQILAAIAWAERDSSTSAIMRLLALSNPLPRAIAIAACGARRADPGEQLAAWLADPSPLLRARAARTAGQLGRADLKPQLLAALADPDPECAFWAAWAAARMGSMEPLRTLGTIARSASPRADRALDLLLRRLTPAQAGGFMRDFARDLPERRRSLIRATGIIGDPRAIPWLIERMHVAEESRLAGEAFSMITGLDLPYLDLDRDAPEGFEAGPNDDPADENVALDEDENLPWPDPAKLGDWWVRRRERFPAGTAFFLGEPKERADWLGALSDAYQRQRLAAALELAIRQPSAPLFECRARGRLQRQQLVHAMTPV
jgi:uncharacterized protein (TIGR02270 family)